MGNSAEEGKSARHWLAIRMFGRDLPWYWTLIILAALVVAMHLGIRLQAKDATSQFLDGFAWLGKGSFRNASYDFDGRVQASDLAIAPDKADAGTPIRIPRVTVQTPGIFWLLRAQLPSFDWFNSAQGGKHGGSNHYPPTRQLQILFEDVDWAKIGMADVLPDVSWVGPYSGAAFEAAGCSADWWWHRDAFAKNFKLAAPGGNISLLFRVEDDAILQQTLEFGTPETSHAIIERRFALPAADDFLDTPPDQWRTLEVRWSFRDHGFNKARNRYCAEQAGITEAEFIERHVAAVQRLMEAKGLRFPRNMWLAYRRYAEGGKELSWQSGYGEGVAWEDVSEKRGAALFRAINASVHVEGFPRVPYLPEVIEARPLPADRHYASLYAVVQSEGVANAALIDPLTASLDAGGASTVDPLAGTAQSTSAQANTVVDPAAAAGPDQAPAIVPVPPPEVPAPVLPGPAAAPASDAAATADATSSAAAPDAAVSGAATPAVPVDVPQLVAGSELPSRELGKHLGMYVRVELTNGRSYVGAVVKNDADAVTLKVRMRAGNASLMLPHKQIRRVTKQ